MQFSTIFIASALLVSAYAAPANVASGQQGSVAANAGPADGLTGLTGVAGAVPAADSINAPGEGIGNLDSASGALGAVSGSVGSATANDNGIGNGSECISVELDNTNIRPRIGQLQHCLQVNMTIPDPPRPIIV